MFRLMTFAEQQQHGPSADADDHRERRPIDVLEGR
jgi:hypothetical protein